VSFVTIVILTCTITTFIIIYGYRTSNPSSMEFSALVTNFADHDYYNSFNEQIVLYGNKFDFQNFSVFSIFAITFKHFLRVNNNNLNLYLYFQQMITFAFVLA
jgi:hypothetical protein